MAFEHQSFFRTMTLWDNLRVSFQGPLGECALKAWGEIREEQLYSSDAMTLFIKKVYLGVVLCQLFQHNFIDLGHIGHRDKSFIVGMLRRQCS